jgi:hypothetical protein
LKYWRRITVEDVFYRWMVVDIQVGKGADTFQRSIHIYAEDHPGSKCIFVSEETGHLWLWSTGHSMVVRPRLVANCIRYALSHGWDPTQPANPFRVNLTADLLSQLDSPDS